MTQMREPYVGSGVDGALRSACIDESEADGLALTDPRREHLLESASRWRDQAAWITAFGEDAPPTTNSIVQAAHRYDTDPAFRATVDGTAARGLTDADIDWDAVERAGRLLEQDRPE